MVLKGKKLKTNSASFYVETGADISIIKENKLKSSIQINKGKNWRYDTRPSND
jgi:hypothetical protein